MSNFCVIESILIFLPGRAWKREFGTGSDWGRRGLFRVIGMEQFAHVLVEAVEHMSN